MSHDALRLRLEELADPKLRDFSGGLIPGCSDLLGVRIPQLRALAKQIVQSGQWADYLQTARDDSFEEVMLQGLVTAAAPLPDPERQQALRRYVAKITNWSLCDSVATSCRFMRRRPEIYWPFLTALADDGQEYAIRFALVCMLSQFVRLPEYLPKVLDFCAQTGGHEGYYVKMAAAWAVSVCAVYAFAQTERFLAEGRLDAAVHAMALQKCRDSLRLTAGQKESLNRTLAK